MALILNNPSSSSSSSSSNTSKFEHDVFISFRGEDTRYNFTGHLYKALCDKQIQTYIDDKLNRGDEISPSLLKAIEESKISVIIFSKDYASSKWCLQELVKILECKKRYGQTVFPVFYNVDPTDVRNQTSTFGDAFTEHEQQQSLDQVQRWKDALKEAANLSGWHSRTIKYEYLLIDNIVEHILKRLNAMSSSDSKGLVGIDTGIKQIVSWLETEDVRSVGIWGMGGIGKTTLAEAVFNRMSSQFKGSYFVPDIREMSERSGGLNHQRGELLSTVLEDRNLNIGTATVRHAFTRDRLRRKKLLIVFDDVTDFQQIEDLIGGFDCLNPQSRIIITTRDKKVLMHWRVDRVYGVQELFHREALEVFRRHAFKENHLSEDYIELSEKVFEYTRGVPLALKVLGSFLCDNSEQEWKSAISKLQRVANKRIQDKLKISYDELDREEQRIFLDIACFFKRKNKDSVINILNAFGFSAEIVIRVLIEKSLISLSNDSIITMHDLLQAMAREIVQQESVEPGKRSRLWDYDDIYRVLTKDKGSEMIEAISLDMSSSNARDIKLPPRAFAKMENLRLLEFYVSHVWHNCGNKVHVLDEGLEFVLNELKYLYWYGFPLKSLPPNFQSENLVILKMRDSNLEELWSGFMELVSLKRIDLTGSKQLIRCPDFSGTLNLKSLMLDQCTSLSEIPSSIQLLTKLESLSLSYCKSLMSIPNCSGLKSLKGIILHECSKLKRLPELPNNLETLSIVGCKSLVEIPSSFKYLNKVKSLDFSDCGSLESIPDLRGWKSLKELRGFYCFKLKMLPEVPNNIERLHLFGARIEELPPSFEDLDSLNSLHLEFCSMLKSLPSSICKSKSLKSLYLSVCSKIDKLLDNKRTLEYLKSIVAIEREKLPSISYFNERFKLSRSKGEDGVGLILPHLSGLDNLKHLFLNDCRIKEIPPSISCLKRLGCLELSGCKGEDGVGLILPPLSGLDNLWCLHLRDCIIKEIPPSISCLKRLKQFVLLRCKGEDGVGLILPPLSGLDNLWCLYLRDCIIKEIPPSISCLKRLEGFELAGCKGEDGVGLILPPLSGLDNLKYLYLSDCRIKEILPSISCLKRLEHFELARCKGEDGVGLILPPLSGLDNLKHLLLWGCRIKEIPPSISCLKRLDSLDLSRCKGEDGVGLILPPLSGLDNLKYLFLRDCGITELPDSFGCLTSLEWLVLSENNFESIPGSLSKRLVHFDISNCERIKVLPKLRYWTSISAVNCTSLEELPFHSFHNNSFDHEASILDANFTNCFKLNRNSLNYFLEGIVLEMQRLATSIVKRYQQVSGGEIPLASICYPENDIPEWFSFQSTRSFIDVKLPQHCFNYNFICLALSVVLTISNPDHQCDHKEDYYHKYSHVNCKVIVKSKYGYRCLSFLFYRPCCGPNCIKSNHVIIGFGYRFVRELCDDEFSFRFYVGNRNESNIEHIKVVKCGVHLTFGLNLKTSGDDAPQEIEYDDEFSSGDDTPQEIETYRITPRDQGNRYCPTLINKITLFLHRKMMVLAHYCWSYCN